MTVVSAWIRIKVVNRFEIRLNPLGLHDIDEVSCFLMSRVCYNYEGSSALNGARIDSHFGWAFEETKVLADGDRMSGQQDQAKPEVLGDDNTPEVMSNLDTDMDTPIADNDWKVAGIDKDLTPLQYHYLSLLQRIVTIKNTYQTSPDYEAWKMGALNKAIYSTLRDSIEANVGEEAKELLNREQHVN